MEHSVEAYLERQPTQILEHLVRKNTGTREEELVDIISGILRKRMLQEEKEL